MLIIKIKQMRKIVKITHSLSTAKFWTIAFLDIPLEINVIKPNTYSNTK